MKRFILFFILAVPVFASCSRDAAILRISESHPRILANAGELARLKKDIDNQKNPYLVSMHEAIIATADEASAKKEVYGWRTDSAGKRLPSIYNSATELVACTYAYRLTGEEKYLSRVEALLDDVCALPSWNPRHFLDVSQGAFSTALAYDWLYDDLSGERKARILECLREYVIEAAEDPRYELFLRKLNNWNQVCNGGVITAAICLYDIDPEGAEKALLRAIERNHIALDPMFAPDGIYPEGPGYMGFGCGWQVLINSVLTSAFGSDLGLSEVEGFDKAPLFRLFCHGATEKTFNFSDNTEKESGFPMMWYFADRFKDNSYLYYETLPAKENGKNLTKMSNLLQLIYVMYAAKYDGKPIPTPTEHLFSGNGIQPLVMARTGWGSEDLYLGLKGGNPTNGHAHLDCGSFVFDAFGYRWASDLPKGEYTYYESHFESNRYLWMKTADSPRWRLFAYNNKQHNTLTINNKDHVVTGYAPLVGVVDRKDAIGGTVDLNNCFGGMTFRVRRTALIRENSWLEITDDIMTSEDDNCDIRWTMATEAEPEIVSDGILLKQGGITMKLQAEGADVVWQTWPSDPAAYEDAPYGSWDKKQPNIHLCGFTTAIPKGKREIITTSLKRI